MLKPAELSVVGISESTLSGYLKKRRELLSGTNYQLLSCFAYVLKAEGQSPWSIYIAVRRVAKFAYFLRDHGRSLTNPDPMHFTAFLSMQGSRENIRRYAALKKLYKFMKEKVDKRYTHTSQGQACKRFQLKLDTY